MVRTIAFDNRKGTVQAFDSYKFKQEQFKHGPDTVIWTHLVSNEDKVIDIIMDDFGQDESFEQDLLEDQRPRLTTINSSTVVVIGAPVKAIMTVDDPDEGIIQISFIIKKNKLISVSDRNSIIINKIMDQYLAGKFRKVDPTIIFSRIFEEIIENVIKVIELLEKRVELLQSKIIHGHDLKGLIKEVEEIKDNLFYTQKILRADIEVAREVLFGKTDIINVQSFNSHIEDRLLYSLDIVEVARQSLDGINSLYMAAISNKMNEHVYKLTVLGAMLFIPAVIAGFWGMNVELPIHNFWLIVIISVLISLLLLLWLKFSRVRL